MSDVQRTKEYQVVASMLWGPDHVLSVWASEERADEVADGLEGRWAAQGALAYYVRDVEVTQHDGVRLEHQEFNTRWTKPDERHKVTLGGLELGESASGPTEGQAVLALLHRHMNTQVSDTRRLRQMETINRTLIPIAGEYGYHLPEELQRSLGELVSAARLLDAQAQMIGEQLDDYLHEQGVDTFGWKMRDRDQRIRAAFGECEECQPMRPCLPHIEALKELEAQSA